MQLKSYRGIDQKVLSLVASVLVICHNRVSSFFKSITLRIYFFPYAVFLFFSNSSTGFLHQIKQIIHYHHAWGLCLIHSHMYTDIIAQPDRNAIEE